MSQKAPNAQTPAEARALRAAWEAQPAVIQMTADVRGQIEREGLQWGAAGLTRAFALVRAWEAVHGELPDAGIHAGG